MIKKIKYFWKKIKQSLKDKKRWQSVVGLLVVLLFVGASILINSNVWAKFYRTQGPTTGFSYGYGYGYEAGYGYGYGYYRGQGSADYGYLMSQRYPTSATSSLTSTGITITVTRNYLSYARVTYGTSSGVYTATTTYTTSTATSSAITLTGLTPNTTYYYKSQVKDIAGHEYLEQTEHSFVTLANKPTGLTGTADSQTQITISWNANSNPSGTEYYAENTTAGTNSGWITATSWTSSGLSCGTSYSFRVKARNSEGKETGYTSSITVSTKSCGGGGGGVSGGDVNAPSISDIKVIVADTYATISWKTNEPSLSWILYGTTTDYGLEKKTATYTTSHSLTLTGLTPETTYHYQLKSKDSRGNIGSYTDRTFTTLALGEKPREIGKPMTLEEIRAKMIEIIAKIKELISYLQSLLGVTEIEGIPAGFTFQKNLSYGMSDQDVVYLKIILAQEGCVSGLKNTKWFGPKTKEGVKCFCQKYKEEISQFAGYEVKCTGFVGKGIREKLNQLISK